MCELVIGEGGCPAIVDQCSGIDWHDPDFLNRPTAALGVDMSHGQRPVGDDAQPLGLALDPESRLVGMQRRALEQRCDGGALPWSKGFMKQADISEAGGFKERATTQRGHEGDRPTEKQHMSDQQGDDISLQTEAVRERTQHCVWECPFRGRLTAGACLDLGLHTGLNEGERQIVQAPSFPIHRVPLRQVGAAHLTGLDGHRLLKSDCTERIRPRTLALCPVLPGGRIRIGLRRRETGIFTRLR